MHAMSGSVLLLLLLAASSPALANSCSDIPDIDFDFRYYSGPAFDNYGSFKNCANMNLTSMPTDLFPGMEGIILDNNSFSTVVPEMFSNITGIKFLRMRHCDIEEIHPYTMENVKGLEYIDFTGNSIKNLSFSMFKFMGDLTMIVLDFNKNIKMNASDIPLESVMVVSLEGCGLEVLPHDLFASMPHLQYVNLDRNRLKMISKHDVAVLPRVATLRIAYNDIHVLYDGLATALDDLDTLDLAHNRLTKLPQNFLKHVERFHLLNISFNHLSDLDLHLTSMSPHRLNAEGNPWKWSCDAVSSLYLFHKLHDKGHEFKFKSVLLDVKKTCTIHRSHHKSSSGSKYECYVVEYEVILIVICAIAILSLGTNLWFMVRRLRRRTVENTSEDPPVCVNAAYRDGELQIDEMALIPRIDVDTSD